MISRNVVFNPLVTEPTDTQLMRLRCDSQSTCFYADMSHYLDRRIPGFQQLSLLDVGPRTGSGLALLRLMHHPGAFCRLKFDPVAGIDIDPSFEAITKLEFPDIQALTGDIFDIEEHSWDIVICSHTIEHIEEAEAFVQQLIRVARRYVVIACPFNEKNLIPGHVRTIDYEFFQSLGFDDIHVYASPQWHSGMVCLAMKQI